MQLYLFDFENYLGLVIDLEKIQLHYLSKCDFAINFFSFSCGFSLLEDSQFGSVRIKSWIEYNLCKNANIHLYNELSSVLFGILILLNLFFFFKLKLNWSVLFIGKCQGRSRLFMRHGKVTANASNVGVGSGDFEESQGNDNQNFISNGSSSDNSSDV